MADPFIALVVNLVIAFLGGLIPVLLWLWFWEHEDKNPEPVRLIVWAFIAGMVSVLLVIPLEDMVTHTPGTLFWWAAIEELAKFIAALTIVLWRLDNDEPIDSIMYMIAVALGFAALENALYILSPLLQGNIPLAITTLDVRFFGATLIHTICSSIVGIALAYSFYRSTHYRWIATSCALLLAIVLHTLFNLFIMNSIGNSGAFALYAVWLGLIALLVVFERVKLIKNQS